tara:strand:- start:369 stop:1244 length:876 start_codon:yes stop_codon:yes gene_type:complete
MSETLTVNDTPQQEGLTTEEQDSLQVGEQLAEQQGELLAGKYKNAEELEQAYVELQKKLGDKDGVQDEGQETQEVEAKDEDTKPEFSDEVDRYSEDGSVNYEAVSQDYGDTIGNLFKEKGVDPYPICETFWKNGGSIPQEMHDQLTGAGLSKVVVDAYLQGRAQEYGMNADLNQTDIDSITKSVGGVEQYKSLMDWAGNNLSQDAINSFDDLVNTGNKGSIQLAVNGLLAQYQNDAGYEGRMLQGKPSKTNTDVYQSQAQLVEAMSDPRYDKDPAYRQSVISKLDRSDLKF